MRKNKSSIYDTMKQFCKFVVVEGENIIGQTVYRAGNYQTPAYFMQALADLAATKKMHSVASKYEGARNAFVATFLSGMAHPHYSKTYYLIVRNNFEKLK